MAVAGVAWAESPAVNKAKSQAETLRAQIDALDAKVEAAVEDYDTATAQLEDTKAAAADNETKLTQAEQDLADAQAKLSDRIVQIYKEGHLEVINTIVGSASFSDLINRLNLLERLSKQDSKLVSQVTDYHKEVTDRKAKLQQQIADETKYTAAAKTAEQHVQAQLAAKEKALKGKEAQVAQLEQEDAAQQAALAAAARQAAAEAKAQEAAARQAASHTTTTKRTTTSTSDRTTTTANHTGTTDRTTTTRHTTTTRRSTTTTDAPPSGGGTSGADVVDYALNYLGCTYVWAGSSPSGFDCSGFSMYVYRHFGISLPHSSSIQSTMGKAVARADLQPGDLVFFFSPVHHVGIYIGGGKMVDAAGTGKGVRIDYLWSSYNCGRRILQ